MIALGAALGWRIRPAGRGGRGGLPAGLRLSRRPRPDRRDRPPGRRPDPGLPAGRPGGRPTRLGRPGLVAGVLFALAFLTKETVLPWAPAPFLAAIFWTTSWVRLAKAAGWALGVAAVGLSWWFAIYAVDAGLVYRLGTPAWTLVPAGLLVRRPGGRSGRGRTAGPGPRRSRARGDRAGALPGARPPSRPGDRGLGPDRRPGPSCSSSSSGRRPSCSGPACSTSASSRPSRPTCSPRSRSPWRLAAVGWLPALIGWRRGELPGGPLRDLIVAVDLRPARCVLLVAGRRRDAPSLRGRDRAGGGSRCGRLGVGRSRDRSRRSAGRRAGRRIGRPRRSIARRSASSAAAGTQRDPCPGGRVSSATRSRRRPPETPGAWLRDHARPRRHRRLRPLPGLRDRPGPAGRGPSGPDPAQAPGGRPDRRRWACAPATVDPTTWSASTSPPARSAGSTATPPTSSRAAIDAARSTTWSTRSRRPSSATRVLDVLDRRPAPSWSGPGSRSGTSDTIDVLIYRIDPAGLRPDRTRMAAAPDALDRLTTALEAGPTVAAPGGREPASTGSSPATPRSSRSSSG